MLSTPDLAIKLLIRTLSQTIVKVSFLMHELREEYASIGKAKKSRPHMPTLTNVERRSCVPYEERSCLRGQERTFGVSRQTVAAWVKKPLSFLLERDRDDTC